MRFSVSLQGCHLPDFISLVSVYRLHCIGSSLQPYHWSDFISLVSVLTLVKLYFIVSACIPAAGQTLFHWFQFTARPLTRILHYYKFTTLPPARLYCIVFSLRPCQLPHFIALVSAYSPATCQTLFHWFQLTTIALVRLYCIGLSWQSRRLSDFIS